MIKLIEACPGSGMTLCRPPAPQGAARAVAAPAVPVLGVCSIKGQSGAGMLNLTCAKS